MENISNKLIEQLVNKAFENLDDNRPLAFMEDLFSKLPGEGQQSLFRGMIENLSPSSTAAFSHAPKVVRLELLDDVLQDNGPWRMCCNMMLNIDRAEDLDLMDAAGPTRLFNALGDETRIKIIKLLFAGKCPWITSPKNWKSLNPPFRTT